MNKKNIKIKNQYCVFPFENVEINSDNKLYFCCQSWQKKSFGDFNENSILDSWNSPTAQEIRASIIDQSYRFCDHEVCPYLKSKSLKTYFQLSKEQKKYFKYKTTVINHSPKQFMLSYDQSCNLSCESCRLEKINFNINSKEYNQLKKLTDKFTNDFFNSPSNKKVKLNITGSGDPFASIVYRQFLENLNGNDFPNLLIDIQTNGVLFTEIMWNRLHKIHKNINMVIVTVDAATCENYHLIRKGGNWNQLLSNINFLKMLRMEKRIKHLQINMVVQKRNYLEMVQFIDLFNQSGIDIIYFSAIADWNTWTQKIFKNHAIWRDDHSEYNKFLEVLSDFKFFNSKVRLGNLTDFREMALVRASLKLSPINRIRFKSVIVCKKYYIKISNLIVLITKIIKKERPIFIE